MGERRRVPRPAAGGPDAPGWPVATASPEAASRAAARARREAGLVAFRDERSAACRAVRCRARSLYEAGGTSLEEIAAEVGRMAATVRRWARADGWTPGPESIRTEIAATTAHAAPPPQRRRLVGRLFAVFERQMARVEKASAGAVPGEADVKVVAALARTLEVLIALQRMADAEVAPAEAEVDVDALREDIARRLDRLAAG